MGETYIKTAFKKENYELLKQAYEKAVEEGLTEFKLEDGSIILTEYAKHLLDYLKPLIV